MYKQAIQTSVSFVVIIWGIHIVDHFFNLELWSYGLYPRKVEGLLGVIFTPLLHSDWSHLAKNTPPMIVMIALLFYGYPKSAKISLITIWLLSGLLAWVFARSHIHIGFSGVNNGLMFFLFTIGVLRGDKLSIALSMIVFFMYGSMIWSIFPNDPKISFELHFFGAALGIMMAFILRYHDQMPSKKSYSWENNDCQDNDFDNDLIGDEWRLDEGSFEHINESSVETNKKVL